MTGKVDNGGAAFPTDNIYGDRGMSLRDWFAGQALAGLCVIDPSVNMIEDKAAQFAYQLADAMIRARSISTKEKGE